MSLESLPLELLAHICLLATDGNNNAARHLHLTSHIMHEAASIHQFHSVLVAGPISVMLLLNTLDEVSPGSARIEHLCICDKPVRYADDRLFRPRELDQPVQENGPFGVPLRPFRPHLEESVSRQLRIADAKDARALAPLLRRILEYAAPNVKSVTLMFFNATHDGMLSVFDLLRFPHLQTLSLRFPYWMKVSRNPIASLKMPALQHITFNVEVVTSVAQDTLHTLARDAPILDSIKIEGVLAGLRLTEYMDSIIEARETADIEPAPWAYLDYSVYPVDPDPLRPSNHQTNPGTFGELHRFNLALERMKELGVVGLEVHGMAASMPGFLEWAARWRRMVKQDILLGTLGRI